MSIDFERWKLLEFFDEEKFLETEGQRIDYITHTNDNCLFTLYIAPYDDVAIVTLTRQPQTGTLTNIIFEVGFKNVCKIDCTQTELLIYKKMPQNWYDTADFTITVKPNVRLLLTL